MLIAVLSDTHSRIATIERAISLLRGRGVQTVLHCGDIEDATAVEPFAGLDAHFVLGNCDGDKAGIRKAIAKTGLTLHEPFGDLELAGTRLAFLHGDDGRLLRDLENSGHFDYLFHGHTHQAGERKSGTTRVINPGALHRARPKTFLLLDLATGGTESVIVDP
jgi:putative phosphoesterase